MFRSRYSLAIASAVVATIAVACSTPHQQGADFNALAPNAESPQGWSLALEPETYVGEDLFQLINGGAELYHELGFERVLSAEYADAEQRSITLELFEMADPGAAYGVYSLKIGSGGEPVAIGAAGVLDAYYMNFWMGPYVVTLTGMDDDAATRNGILAIAAAVEGRLGALDATPPPIVMDLAALSDRPDRVRYFRGALALSNTVPLFSGTSFGMTDGAASTAGEHQLFVLSYPDEAEARAHVAAATQKLSAAGRFTLESATASSAEYRLVASDENVLRLAVEGARVNGVYGPAGSQADTLFASLGGDG